MVCRVVSAYRNKFEEYGNYTHYVQKYGNLTFPEFVDVILAQDEEYKKNNEYQFDEHWRPFYLSRCDFCHVPFKGELLSVITQVKTDQIKLYQ